MQYPTPTHLKNLLVVDASQSGEHELRGQVKCECGSDVFHPLYVAQLVAEKGRSFLRVTEIGDHCFLRLGAQCISCSQEHLLLDHDYHGWNGYVCGDEASRRLHRPPYQHWACER